MTQTRQRRYDAVVVGAGVIGLACGWRLSALGMSVCVLERDRPAAGATGAAAGMLAPVGEASWGEAALLELNLASHLLWPGFAAELARVSGIEPGFSRLGALHVALDRDEAEALRPRHRLQLELGLRADWLSPRECRELEPGLSPSVAGGVHAADEAAVVPAWLAEALAGALASAGGELRSGAEAARLLRSGDAVGGIETADGSELLAPVVVGAVGPWSGVAEWLPVAARPPVRPVKGEILTLGPRRGPRVCERIVAGERFYAVPRPDGSLVVGSTVREDGFDMAVTAGGVHELLREAYRTLPEVAELEFVSASARARPGTPDNGPVIGATSIDGLIMATGHYRNGILQAPITADAVAALVTGAEPPATVAPFGPQRFAPESSPAGASPAGAGVPGVGVADAGASGGGVAGTGAVHRPASRQR